MSDLVSKIKEIYAAFGRGDIEAIMSNVTDDVRWDFEAPKELSWGGNRKGKAEAMGFFTALAAEQSDPVLKMTEFFATPDAVAAFGRYDATVRATGVRVGVPVAHYFKFRDGKISHYINITNTAAFVEAAKAPAKGTKVA
jgi:uncharacterized protein